MGVTHTCMRRHLLARPQVAHAAVKVTSTGMPLVARWKARGMHSGRPPKTCRLRRHKLLMPGRPTGAVHAPQEQLSGSSAARTSVEAELARLQQQLTFARAGERQQVQAQAAMKAEQRALQQQLEVRDSSASGLSLFASGIFSKL